MKSFIFKRGILERVRNLIRFDMERRGVKVISESNLIVSIHDQLTIERNGYDYKRGELESVLIALLEAETVEYVSCIGDENYYMI